MTELPSRRAGPSRPTLVAVPEPNPERAGDPHAAVRLELERSLTPPRTPGGGSAALAPTVPAVAAEPVTTIPADGGSEPIAARERVTAAQPVGSAGVESVLVRALRAELAMRAAAEAGLRARALDAETRLAARVLLGQRTIATLDQIRVELARVASGLADERARRQIAERRVAELEAELVARRGDSDRAGRELAALQESLRERRQPDERGATLELDGAAAGSGADLEPARLTDALSRLRATVEPLESPVGVAPRGPVAVGGALPAVAAGSATGVLATDVAATVAEPFRRLCRADSAMAGRLAVSLLGLQASVYAAPVSYDVLLGGGHGTIQVSSADGAVTVVRSAVVRPIGQVELQIAGSPARFAKLLAAGRLRRRLGLGLAHVRGNRAALAALDSLLTLPLDLPALAAGGLGSDVEAMLTLVAAMISPQWTRGERFAISHRDGDSPPTYLLVGDGRAPTVTQTAPTGRIATVISCADVDLASVIAGDEELGAVRVQVLGDRGPLAQLQSWVKRAQSE